jgi:hypothetical protein
MFASLPPVFVRWVCPWLFSFVFVLPLIKGVEFEESCPISTTNNLHTQVPPTIDRHMRLLRFDRFYLYIPFELGGFPARPGAAIAPPSRSSLQVLRHSPYFLPNVLSWPMYTPQPCVVITGAYLTFTSS